MESVVTPLNESARSLSIVMPSNRMIVRWARFAPARRALVVEAAVSLAVAALCIRLLPFLRTIAWGARPLDARKARASAIADVIGTIEAIAPHLPWRNKCFEQGLAAQRMLRRRGIDARLHYGLGKEGDGSLVAHVWVTVDAKVVIGGEAPTRFETVAIYPS